MNKDSTSRAIREALGWLIVGVVVLYLATMAGFFSVSEAGAKPRVTPTVGCRPGVEGREFCGDRFATSVARPGDYQPKRGTPVPTRRPNK